MKIKAAIATAAGVLVLLCLALYKPAGIQRRSVAVEQQRRVLRVCADPNNLPFSNAREEGFENRLAKLIAAEMNADLEYFWWAQHRGFIRNTLGQNRCDVILGIASGVERVLTTAPYYRSTWVFVSRSDRRMALGSFQSPLLRKLRIGVHLIGDDGANTPPVHALERRNLAANIVGFSLTGDYTEENPPTALLKAVVSGEVDTAIAWGPLAGYFARAHKMPLDLVPVTDTGTIALPMAYDISAGVRREDVALRAELDEIFKRRRREIEQTLDAWGIPRPDGDGNFSARKHGSDSIQITRAAGKPR